MKDTTEDISTPDRTISLVITRAEGKKPLLDALMRTCRAEEHNILAHHPMKVGLIEDLCLVQTHFAD